MRTDYEILDYQWLINDINYYKNIEKNLNKKFILLIDAFSEAPTYRYNFKNSGLDYIVEHTNLELNDIIILSGAYHQYNDPVKFCFCHGAMSYSAIMLENTTYDIEPNYHFVSLARLAKWHRIVASISIIERDLEKYGNLSLGCGYDKTPMDNYFLKHKLFKKYHDKFPMYIDEEILVNGNLEKKLNKFKQTNEKISHAFVNFVMESAYENIYDSWNVPFITEKSIKPFAWGQVPIFLNFSNSLYKLRELGFDLFDDIIDHSYDFEPNKLTRIKLVVDQLEKICQWSLDDCRKFKKENMHRFEKNRQTLSDLYDFGFEKIINENLQLTLDSYDN